MKISGYSVSYTGARDVGYFKLHINLNQQILRQELAKLKEHPKSDAAANVNFALDHFFKKTN